MSQNDFSLTDLREGDRRDPVTPLINEDLSSTLHRNRTSLWRSSIHIARPSDWPRLFCTTNSIKAWIQKSPWLFKKRGAPSNAKMANHEQSIPLVWEDLEGNLDISTLDDGPRFASLEHLGPWFPEANPAHTKAQTWRTWRSKRQRVLSACSMVAFLVFLVNLTTTVYFKTKWKTIGDLGTIFRGDCSQSHQISSRLHIVINLLSTTLLAASNICMQLLAAPTRKEIDEAHGKHVWLDIGVPSFRNLKYISKRRSMAIFLLATSSIPLHFL